MGKITGISWTDHTFNPWWGCTKVGGSPACENCYAETLASRRGFDVWGNGTERRFLKEGSWKQPVSWNRAALKAGQRRRVFCMSMGDWAEGRPDQREHRERLWNVIEQTPGLDWLMLTKRPQSIRRLYPRAWQENPPLNVWMGTTAETQDWVDNRWAFLRQVPAAVYWLSIEPLFERITLPDDFLSLGNRGWVIVGGESGHAASPMSPDWARYLRDQCIEAGVRFHFKQWGEFAPDDGSNPTKQRAVVDGHQMVRLGKKAAGRVLDGRTWDEVPSPRIDLAWRPQVVPLFVFQPEMRMEGGAL